MKSPWAILTSIGLLLVVLITDAGQSHGGLPDKQIPSRGGVQGWDVRNRKTHPEGSRLLPLPRGELDSPPTLTNSIGMKLRLIPAGEFTMGSSKEEAERMAERIRQKKHHPWYLVGPLSEWPHRRVKITQPFYLGVYEVTVGEFRKFVEATDYHTDAEKDGEGADGCSNGKWETKPGYSWKNTGLDRNDQLPVMNVTWNDAVAFCQWLSAKEGQNYRLPTEAEWEYACRAGTATPFYWGSDESQRDQYAWSGANSGGVLHPVGQLKANGFGLYDMIGSVYEYCSDWYAPTAYVAALMVDPAGPATGTEIVVRSASWSTDSIHCRSAFRGSAPKTHRNRRDGFRVLEAVHAAGRPHQ